MAPQHARIGVSCLTARTEAKRDRNIILVFIIQQYTRIRPGTMGCSTQYENRGCTGLVPGSVNVPAREIASRVYSDTVTPETMLLRAVIEDSESEKSVSRDFRHTAANGQD